MLTTALNWGLIQSDSFCISLHLIELNVELKRELKSTIKIKQCRDIPHDPLQRQGFFKRDFPFFFF